VFYFLNGMTGNFTFANMGSGPNGFGGISSIRLFAGESNSVPDHGATVALLGAAVLILEVLRRSLAGKTYCVIPANRG
jgi:VPDSG-CTERM motif